MPGCRPPGWAGSDRIEIRILGAGRPASSRRKAPAAAMPMSAPRRRGTRRVSAAFPPTRGTRARNARSRRRRGSTALRTLREPRRTRRRGRCRPRAFASRSPGRRASGSARRVADGVAKTVASRISRRCVWNSTRSPNSPARWASEPQRGGGCEPGGGGGANGASVRNSAPIMPSGVQLSSPMVPPRLVVRSSSPAAAAWSGANIAPIAEITTSNDSSANGRFSASPSIQSSSRSAALARRCPASSNSGVRSSAVTTAPAAAAGSEALPVPAATSSTVCPGSMPDASTIRWPSGSSQASTIAA